MRFLKEFTLGAIPELQSLLCSSSSLQTPDPHFAERRFLFLSEPDRTDSHARSSADHDATLVVVGNGVRLQTLASLQCGLVLAEAGITGFPDSVPVVRIHNARAVIAVLLRTLADTIHRETPFSAGTGNLIHPSAVVEGVIEGDVTVEAGAVIMKGAFIGRGARVEANAVICEHVFVGANTVIQSGVVVGAAGFGFYADPTQPPTIRGPRAMPHVAGVVVGADCFVGANTVIAAGVLHPTTLGDGCKLDSHVQIAHNVMLGAGALMASQSGIAGSTTVGENFRIGGAASVAGHLRLGDNVSVAAKSGVTKDVSDGITVAGFPARPIAQWRRAQAAFARMGWSLDSGA
jgi:UDP-3-O-[3-hydroxymyristoyl] glucosamine N-acyltransferase LpxD